MAGQDIKKRLLPGQSQPIQVGGDFIYLKSADRPITVIINGGQSAGSRVIMEAGDKYRPGNFQSFEIENTDPERPAQVLMTVGRGDYNRMIIQGELTALDGTKTADGTTVQKAETTKRIYAKLNYKKVIGRTPNSVYPVTDLEVELGLHSAAAGYHGAIQGWNGVDSAIVHYDERFNEITRLTLTENTDPGKPYIGGFTGGTVLDGYAYIGHNNGRVYRIKKTSGEASISEKDLFARVSTTEPNGFFKVNGKVYAWGADRYSYDLETGSRVPDFNSRNLPFVAEWNDTPYIFSMGSYINQIFLHDLNFNFVETKTVSIKGSHSSNAFSEKGGYARGPGRLPTFVASNSRIVSYYPESEGGDYFEGLASEQCLRLQGILNPQLEQDWEQFKAEISIEWRNGKAYVSGEVIRSVLFLLGIYRTDYMDLITSLKLQTSQGQIEINGAGLTLAAGDIQDDFFQVEIPSVVTITAFKELWG